MKYPDIIADLTFVYPESMVSRQDLDILYESAVRLKAKTILELGTGFGYSTLALGYAAVENDGRVFSVDIRDQNKMKPILRNLPVELIQADDRTLSWAAKIDVLFIDTSHEYAHTRQELFKFMPWVTGECFMHDVLHEAHTKDELRAIEDFRREKPEWKFEITPTTLNNSPIGMGRLYR